jgi:antitoxin HigA-1
MKENGMRPSHPGAILTGMIEGLREESGKDYSISEIAAGLGISSETLSSILGQKSAINAEMAVKLSQSFNTSAALWLNLQRNYDLSEADNHSSKISGAFPTPPAATAPPSTIA